jgi:hypothetical protein
MVSDEPARSAAGLLVVAVDRLPAWMLPPHGCGWVAMPALTRLASRGVVFDRVIATGADADATLADLCGGGTGPADAPLVLEAARRGWAPLVVTDARDPAATGGGRDGGVTQGGAAGALEVRRVPVGTRRAPAADEADTSLARACAVAADALATGRHRLVVVHLTSLGLVWDAPAAFREAYVDPEDPPAYAGAAVPDLVVTDATDPDELVGIRQAFAGQLTLLDRCLDALLARVTAAGDGWGVLVAGLRGLPLGLHGRVGCGPLPAYGELVHVPALLVDPGGRMAAQRCGGLVTPGDLGATLVELIGGPPAARPNAEPWRPASLGGLLAAWRWHERDRVVAAVAAGPAIATAAWHAVAPGAAAVRLFAKPDDYFEMNDVAERCPTERERFGGLLTRVAAGDAAAAWTAPLEE